MARVLIILILIINSERQITTELHWQLRVYMIAVYDLDQ